MNILTNLLVIICVLVVGFRINVFVGICALIGISIITYIFSYSGFLLGRANAEFNQRNYDKAFELYEKAYKSKTRKYTVDVAYAQALMRTGQPQKAIDVVNAILSSRLSKEIKFPAKLVRIMSNFKLNNLDEAYEEAIELFDDGYTISNMYCLVGLLMIATNKPLDETTAFCEKAYDYDCDNRDIADNLLVCYIKNKNYEKATELSKILTEQYPLFIEGWYHTALMYYNMGDNTEAKYALSKIKDCDRTYMTTISEEAVAELENKLI